MITKELRDYVWKKVPSKHLEDLIDIADAIEQKHEEELAMQRERVRCEIADKFDGWVVPPKDADGVLIHIGDELDSAHYEAGTVTGIRYYEGVETLIAVRPHGWDTASWRDPESYTHAQPDSWEAIIEEAASYGDRHGFSGLQCDKAIIAELVERCKRLAGEE